MSIGPVVRRLAGPFEPTLARLYREVFFDVDALARVLRERVSAETILEIGCGEGALVERLVVHFPEARVTAIDPSPRVGRLFRGDRSRVEFLVGDSRDVALRSPAAFDLVLIVDVLHHVPWERHASLLSDARRALRPGGTLVVKEWERRSSPIHWLGWFSDRVVTGDRIRYGRAQDWRRTFRDVFGSRALAFERRLPPWRNNVAFFLRPDAED